jgi:hypothetical protein
MESQGQPIAVNDQHPLGALALLGESDLVATVLGGRE